MYVSRGITPVPVCVQQRSSQIAAVSGCLPSAILKSSKEKLLGSKRKALAVLLCSLGEWMLSRALGPPSHVEGHATGLWQRACTAAGCGSQKEKRQTPRAGRGEIPSHADTCLPECEPDASIAQTSWGCPKETGTSWAAAKDPALFGLVPSPS